MPNLGSRVTRSVEECGEGGRRSWDVEEGRKTCFQIEEGFYTQCLTMDIIRLKPFFHRVYIIIGLFPSFF